MGECDWECECSSIELMSAELMEITDAGSRRWVHADSLAP